MFEKDSWEMIKAELHCTLASEAYQNWVARTSFAGLEGTKLRVLVPDDVTKVWLEREYSSRVGSAIRQLKLPVSEVRYELPQNVVSAVPSGTINVGERLQGSAPTMTMQAVEFPVLPKQLNPRLTFDSFVIGSCNQFAHAAAAAVAASPSKKYNPLFIYGGSGMGKTHLIHAIGNQLAASFSTLKVVYTTGERFMNEMVQCIRTDRMGLFHQHYRNADVLLVDDIHVLAGKERTQEEFFHTFNDLYDHQKQLVITSDQLPKHTHGLVERLRSRFEWGLIIDIQPPDLETKMAILDKKAEAEGLTLPNDVRIYLATKTKASVRELEGAWTRLLAHSSLTQAPITLAMTQQALKQLQPNHDRKITIDAVVRTVADRYSMQPSQLRQKTNAHSIARPRQVAMYLAKELTSASLPEIGRAFGGKHHTTVLHSIRKVEELRQSDPDLNKLIHNVIDSFN